MHTRLCLVALILLLSLGCGLVRGGADPGAATETPRPSATGTLAPSATVAATHTPTVAAPTPSITPESGEPGVIEVLWRAGGKGELSTLGGLDTDGAHVYVAAAYQGAVVFDFEGRELGVLAPGEIGYIVDVKVGPQGNVYIADNALHLVTLFNRDGDFLGGFGGLGPGDGEFGPDGPLALAVSPEGEVFVLDPNEDVQGDPLTRVQVFDAEGMFLRSFALNSEFDVRSIDSGPDGTLFAASPDGYIAEFTPDDGRLIQRLGLDALRGVLPQAVALDGAGNMAVTTLIPAAVAVVGPLGDFVGWVGEETVRTAEGWPEGEFLFPFGVAVTDDGRTIIVGDTYEDFAYITAMRVPYAD